MFLPVLPKLITKGEKKSIKARIIKRIRFRYLRFINENPWPGWQVDRPRHFPLEEYA